MTVRTRITRFRYQGATRLFEKCNRLLSTDTRRVHPPLGAFLSGGCLAISPPNAAGAYIKDKKSSPTYFHPSANT
jgi:hypothetical protein